MSEKVHARDTELFVTYMETPLPLSCDSFFIITVPILLLLLLLLCSHRSHRQQLSEVRVRVTAGDPDRSIITPRTSVPHPPTSLSGKISSQTDQPSKHSACAHSGLPLACFTGNNTRLKQRQPRRMVCRSCFLSTFRPIWYIPTSDLT